MNRTLEPFRSDFFEEAESEHEFVFSKPVESKPVVQSKPNIFLSGLNNELKINVQNLNKVSKYNIVLFLIAFHQANYLKMKMIREPIYFVNPNLNPNRMNPKSFNIRLVQLSFDSLFEC